MVRYHTGVCCWGGIRTHGVTPLFHSPVHYFKSLVHSATLTPNKAERVGLEPTPQLIRPKNGLAIRCSTNYAYLSKYNRVN